MLLYIMSWIPPKGASARIYSSQLIMWFAHVESHMRASYRHLTKPSPQSRVTLHTLTSLEWYHVTMKFLAFHRMWYHAHSKIPFLALYIRPATLATTSTYASFGGMVFSTLLAVGSPSSFFCAWWCLFAVSIRMGAWGTGALT